MRRQQGLVLVLSLLVLVSVTILGVSAVSSGLMQSKMAVSMQENGMAFDAAEAAIAGVLFEAEDKALVAAATDNDPLTDARKVSAFDPTADALSCNGDDVWVDRFLTKTGLEEGKRHITSGDYQTIPKTESWSKTAYVREQPCLGSSNVVGGNSFSCHVFVVRGCGRVVGKSTVTANTLTTSVFAPASQ